MHVGIRRKVMQLTDLKGGYKSYILIKRWTNEACKFMADYPSCNHSSILLNLIYIYIYIYIYICIFIYI